MEIIVLFSCVVAAATLQIDENFYVRQGIPPAEEHSERDSKAAWGTIIQRLDHFDPTNSRTWPMRYIENGQFYKSGGPIFIMLGAEWTIDPGWVQSGLMFDIAKIHGAQMYYTEHRYFGASYPTLDISTNNLRYLTVDQASADAANFIETKKYKTPGFGNSTVIVFGGSYGATMATWMRQKYPQLVHGAVASSAPLFAKTNFNEYYRVVQNALGTSCASVLQNASSEIRLLVNMGEKEKVEKDFKTCSPFQDDNDIQALFSYIASTFGSAVQYGNQASIDSICSRLKNKSPNASDYDSLVAYMRSGSCKGSYKDIVNYYKYTQVGYANARQWLYQCCTNFGWFQTAWGLDSLFNYGVSPNFYNKQCSDVFGPQIESLMQDNVEATNMEHGGLNVGTTRVLSIHGSIDPWHAIGVREHVNPESPTYIVPGASHCQDMYSINGQESIEMLQAKLAVKNNVALWLKVPYQE